MSACNIWHSVLLVLAEAERHFVRERTKRAIRCKSVNGEFCGGTAPYGYRIAEDRQLEPVEVEQRIIAEARRLRASGLTLRAVAKRLEVLGARSRSGRSFAAVQVSRMVDG